MWDFFIFWLVLHAVFALYLFIRSLIDPKFAEKLSEMNRREKGKREEENQLTHTKQTCTGIPCTRKLMQKLKEKEEKRNFVEVVDRITHNAFLSFIQS